MPYHAGGDDGDDGVVLGSFLVSLQAVADDLTDRPKAVGSCRGRPSVPGVTRATLLYPARANLHYRARIDAVSAAWTAGRSPAPSPGAVRPVPRRPSVDHTRGHPVALPPARPLRTHLRSSSNSFR
jgi:hypothetical protein